MTPFLFLAACALVGCTSASTASDYHIVSGRVPLDWQGPDGNSAVIDAPKGLIVFDTGRSPAHAQAIIDYARQRGKPIAAIINSHWHLDHTTGNYDIRQAYPQAHVYASRAIEGALVGFLGNNREQGDKMLADPKTPEGAKAQILRGRHRLDNPDTLRPTEPITRSAKMTMAGRPLEVHLSNFAASEGDVWVYDPFARTLLSGDLVVGLVPFMDTACVDGWKTALAEINAVPFKTLIPGHGEPMTRIQFEQWRTAFNNLVECGRSDAEAKTCVAGWQRDAAPFIDSEHKEYVDQAAAYYIETRLRSSPEEQQKYCKPLLSQSS